MKITGAEFMDWYDNHWPGEEWYHEDCYIETHNDDGSWRMLSDRIYDTRDLGYLAYQGDDGSKRFEQLDISTLLRQYRKHRDFAVLVVTVPVGDVKSVSAMLEGYGYKVK